MRLRKHKSYDNVNQVEYLRSPIPSSALTPHIRCHLLCRLLPSNDDDDDGGEVVMEPMALRKLQRHHRHHRNEISWESDDNIQLAPKCVSIRSRAQLMTEFGSLLRSQFRYKMYMYIDIALTYANTVEKTNQPPRRRQQQHYKPFDSQHR